MTIEQAPYWARYTAVDADGETFAYEHKPAIKYGRFQWLPSRGRCKLIGWTDLGETSWRNTLHRTEAPEQERLLSQGNTYERDRYIRRTGRKRTA